VLVSADASHRFKQQCHPGHELLAFGDDLLLGRSYGQVPVSRKGNHQSLEDQQIGKPDVSLDSREAG